MKIADARLCSDAAVCFETADNTLIAASFDDGGELRVKRFAAAASSLHEEISAWRTGLGRKTTARTVFRFVPDLFMEQTRIAALPDDVVRLGDDELTEWLVAAAAADTTGQDGKSVFESSLDDSAYDFTRLPSGQIALTEIPRETVDQTRLKLLPVVGSITEDELAASAAGFRVDAPPEFPQAVETRLRAVARFLAERERAFFSSLGGEETVAFFCFTPQGAGFALWSPASGFYVELGDFFHLRPEDQIIPEGIDKATYLGHLYGESVYNFLNDQFYRRIVPDDDSAAPVNLVRVYWTAAEKFTSPLESILSEFSEQTEFPFISAGVPMEEMVVSGLLLGCFDESTELIPAVNLANDVRRQRTAIFAAAAAASRQTHRARRRTALLYAVLPSVCAVGFILGLLLNSSRISASIDSRRTAATAEKARLTPLINARAEYETTLSWYEDVLRQIVGLRRKQSAALAFAARLDPLFPPTNSFYVSNLKLLPGGNFEIKGLARDQFAVSEFARQLEFAAENGGDISGGSGGGGARYFSNLTLEFKQGSGSDKQSSVAAGVAGSLAPGVSGFLIKGNFPAAGVIIAQDFKPAAAAPAPPAVMPKPAPPTASPAPGSDDKTAPAPAADGKTAAN